jgi:hypothetical protein
MYGLTPARLLDLLFPLLGGGALIVTVAGHFRTAEESPVVNGTEQTRTAVATPAATPADLAEIARWPLFGAPVPDGKEAKEKESAPDEAGNADSLADLPPAALPLQLMGIAFSDDGTRAYAIIGAADGSQRIYQAGEALMPGVTLHSLRAREAVVSNRGKYESLALPIPGGVQGGAGMALPAMLPQLPRVQARPPAAPPPPPMAIDGPATDAAPR